MMKPFLDQSRRNQIDKKCTQERKTTKSFLSNTDSVEGLIKPSPINLNEGSKRRAADGAAPVVGVQDELCKVSARSLLPIQTLLSGTSRTSNSWDAMARSRARDWYPPRRQGRDIPSRFLQRHTCRSQPGHNRPTLHPRDWSWRGDAARSAHPRSWKSFAYTTLDSGPFSQSLFQDIADLYVSAK